MTPSIDALIAVGLFYAGLIVLAKAWVQMRRTAQRMSVTVPAVAVVVLLWSLPLLLGPPLGSRDVYAYAAQGRLAEAGFDPYLEGPSALGADPILYPVDPLYLDAPVVYGPVFVSLSSHVSAAASDLVSMVLAFRALSVLGLLVAAVGVYDIAKGLGRDPVDALILTMANPLVLLHLVSGAHNESLMLAFLVTGVALGRRPRWRLAGVALCAFAAAIKMPAFFGVAFVAWPWVLEARSWGGRIARITLVAAEALAVIALAGYFTGWHWGWVTAITSSDPVMAYLSVTQVIGWAIHTVAGVESSHLLAVFRFGGLALAALTALWLLLRRGHHTPEALALALLTFAVLHPTTQPWYLTWGLFLWAAASAGRSNRLFEWVCIGAAFVVLPMGPHLGAIVLDESGRQALAAMAVVLIVFGIIVTRSGFGLTQSSPRWANVPLVHSNGDRPATPRSGPPQ